MNQRPAGFMSYVRTDDTHDNGRISELRNRLQGEVHIQAGDHTFNIFQDREDITWGQHWKQRIEESLDAVTFLIPIITPSFFKSSACCEELERFLGRERKLQRNDLILPIYYVESPILSIPVERQENSCAKIIASRQYADWRELRFEPLESSIAAKALAILARQIVDALGCKTIPPNSLQVAPQNRVKKNGSPQHPDERLNELIDFGSSLQEIADEFKIRMDTFNSIDGSGPDKYLDLGAHVYTCVAQSLDRFLDRKETTSENRTFLENTSSRLKRLADYGPEELRGI